MAGLLPFEQTILTKLDKLSILRLAVSYLRIKSYFQAHLIKNHLPLNEPANKISHVHYLDPQFSEGNAILEVNSQEIFVIFYFILRKQLLILCYYEKSLNGFILIVNTNSEVFYASRTVENYIGFHQVKRK